jgi:magnesium/cobalt transport protein CorA
MHVWVITAQGAEEHSVADLQKLLQAEEGLIWVDIPHCDDEAVHVLSDVFHFHPMAVQDCVERNRVPKMHAYSDHVFVVLHGPERGEHGHVHYIELDQFIGHRFLVTVHGPTNPVVDPAIPIRETTDVLERIEARRFQPTTPFELSHAIVSAVTREQDEFVETVTKDVWQLEQRLTGGDVGDPEAFLNQLFRARHELLAVRTMGVQSSAIYESLAALNGISAKGHQYVVEGTRQFELVRNVADGQLEYLHGVIEFYQTVLIIKSTLVAQRQNEEVQQLTAASYRQNEDVKKISAWAAIFLAPTLIGTVYGMNFDHMPELQWTFGYPLAVLVMILLPAALHRVFKKRHWL